MSNQFDIWNAYCIVYLLLVFLNWTQLQKHKYKVKKQNIYNTEKYVINHRNVRSCLTLKYKWFHKSIRSILLYLYWVILLSSLGYNWRGFHSDPFLIPSPFKSSTTVFTTSALQCWEDERITVMTELWQNLETPTFPPLCSCHIKKGNNINRLHCQPYS